MASPINITPELAIEIPLLPYTFQQDVTDAPDGTLYPSTCDSAQVRAVWYKYTTGAAKEFLAFNAAPNASPSYTPRVSVWTGDPLAQFTLTDSVGGNQRFCRVLGAAVTFNLPLAPLTTYYFQITDSTVGAHAAVLDVSVELAANETVVPAGSIVIMDDFDGFPMSVFDQTTGAFLRWPYLPNNGAGEFAATVPTGQMCLTATEATDSVMFTDSQFRLVNTWASPGGRLIKAITTNHLDKFYILTMEFTVVRLYSFELDGTPLDTWVLPAGFNGRLNFAVSRDDAIAYLSNNGASSVIKRYDLVSSVALSDLSAAFGIEATTGAGCANVLEDGRIVFTYGLDAGPANTRITIRVFNTDGSVDGEYPIGDATFVKMGRWCLTNDETVMLVWAFVNSPATDPTQPARFRYYNLNTGAQIGTEIVMPVNRNSGETLNGDTWSISDSCPVFVLPLALQPPLTEVVLDIRRLRRFPLPFDRSLWVYISRIEFLIQSGVGLLNEADPDEEPTFGSDPMIQVRFSGNGGVTWGDWIEVSAGVQGDYDIRAVINRIGKLRNGVCEVAVSDPVYWYLLACFIDADESIGG